MIKETNIKKEVTEWHKYCDVCGKEIDIDLACSAARCEFCGKDLCNKCVGQEYDTTGDYREVFCQQCWDLGVEYRPKIDEFKEKIDELYKVWKDKCKPQK